jgi:adenylate cyclase
VCLALPIPHLLRLRREKTQIRNTFSKYVSPKVVAQLIEHPELVRLGGNRVDATVLYLDIAGFSRMATKLSPEALSATLSRYLGHFTESIFNRDGMVDKYVGDAIMAVWGVPLPQPDHPARACRAALDIRRDLAFLLARETLPSDMSLDIRIGINSGAMLAGNVGGDRFLNYTVHGEATNFAVRLEALNKLYGTRILLGENTALQLGEEFLMRKIDCIRLDGNHTHTEIYELIGVALGGDDTILRHIEEFEAARKMFLDRKFREARNAFTKIIADDGMDSVSRVYLERCREYEEKPPSPSWDCVADIHVK